MASSLSILKTVLNLNKNRMHVINCEEQTVTIQRFGECSEQKRILVHARPYKNVQFKCPKCHNKCPGYDTKYNTESTWRAPNLNGVPVYICYQPKRIQCPEHGVLTEFIPWADGTSRFTEDFNNEIAWLCCMLPKTAIALFEGIDWRTVGNCVKAAQGRIEPDVKARLKGLRRICVDETSYRKGFSYITVVYDMDKNRVVWVHEDHGLEIFRLFCEELSPEEREKIEIVAGDGAKWIDTCVKAYFPNATRCIDFFHVAEWANEKLDKVRIATASKAAAEYERQKKEFMEAEAATSAEAAKASEESEAERLAAEAELASLPKRGRPSRRKQALLSFLAGFQGTGEPKKASPSKGGRPRKEQFTPEHQEVLDGLSAKAKSIKGAKHALGHRPENCTEHQADKIKLIENNYPDLYRAYQLKESLRIILHMKDAALASIELDKWIADSAESGLKPMEELSEKIARHRENILNSILYQANSAKSEAVNTTIKFLIKMARGFRNLDNMIALIYLKCSDLVIPLHNRPQMTAEKAAATRKAANERRRHRQSELVLA